MLPRRMQRNKMTNVELGVRPGFARFEVGRIYGKNKEEAYTESPKFRGIYLEGTEKIVCVATDEYKLIQHEDVYKAFEKAAKRLPEDVTSKGIETRTEFGKENMRMFILADFPGKVIEVVPGDIVSFGLVIMNSVDGTTGINVMPFTKNLSNMSCMTHREKLRNVGLFKKHTSQAEEVLRGLPNTIENSFQHLHYLEKLYKEWGLTPVEIDVLIDDMDKAEKDKDTKRLPTKYLAALVEEQDQIKTRWDFFNFLTRHNWNDAKRGIEAKINFNTKIMRLVDAAPAPTNKIEVMRNMDVHDTF
jgi:hypothetical protein